MFSQALAAVQLVCWVEGGARCDGDAAGAETADHGRGRGHAGVALPGGLSASAGAISRRLTRSPSRARPSSTAQKQKPALASLTAINRD